MEPHHVRAMAMELEAETGRNAPGRRFADKWAESMKLVYGDKNGERCCEKYWKNLTPAVGNRDVIKTAVPLDV